MNQASDNIFRKPVTDQKPRQLSPLLASAEALLGESAIETVWFQTRPVPAWAGELVLVVLSAPFRYLFPAPATDTEIKWAHTGFVYCVRTKQHLAFIAARNCFGGRELTSVLFRGNLGDLENCESSFPRNTEVRFRFKSDDPIQLHYLGGELALERLMDHCRDELELGGKWVSSATKGRSGHTVTG